MLTPKLPGWKVECVGDDIAWMKYDEQGYLRAINPEFGFFGVAPGTSIDSNPNALETVKKNSIFTNVAMTPDRDIWWEGMTKEPPPQLKSWLRRSWYPGCGEDAAHPNSRFTAPASQCPVIDPNWQDPKGVPISAIIFGGRRSSTMPLVFEALNWEHGTFLGSVMNSETTAAATGMRGVLRPDPFAMKPFCGYHIGDYFSNWIKIGTKTSPQKLPKVFHVNWFRKSSSGQFIWPGFGDNIRVLKWIFERTEPNAGGAVETAIGLIPSKESLDVSGLTTTPQELNELFKVDSSDWIPEVSRYREFYQTIGKKVPQSLVNQLDNLQQRIDKSSQNHK